MCSSDLVGHMLDPARFALGGNDGLDLVVPGTFALVIDVRERNLTVLVVADRLDKVSIGIEELVLEHVVRQQHIVQRDVRRDLALNMRVVRNLNDRFGIGVRSRAALPVSGNRCGIAREESRLPRTRGVAGRRVVGVRLADVGIVLV